MIVALGQGNGCRLLHAATRFFALIVCVLCGSLSESYGAESAPAVEIEAGKSHETLSGGRADWSSVSVDAAYTKGPRETIYGGLRETRRFSQQDEQATIGLYEPIGTSWIAVFEGTVSPTHRVLPEYSGYAQLQRLFADGWIAAVTVRHTEYTASGANMVAPSVERYWGNFRGAYTLYLARAEGAPWATSHAAQVSYYYGDRNSITLAGALGQEIENVGSPPQLVTTQVRSLTLSGRHWITRSWAVTYELLNHEQGNLYTRRGGRLGVRYRF